ncbi:ornithine cyclodeaminase family protein [Acerihabitans arboris]|uniref:Ornithine cyclodeaminase family protein n=1 Tax=Acerihabitans arboris TaxID=2691583 RepID=A0A845SRN9_9GAMM|nr:ornithine cyclodeaminase family protein [Acerihabitans arboris]NDL65211.1 ornithine cyclodeaminase family protein [Acerihabitans arboris]
MRYFDRQSVENTLPPELCLQLSREAFMLFSQGKIMQSPRDIIAAEDGCIMGTMPACIREGDWKGFGLKTVKVDFSHADGRASHEGVILLYDALPDGGMAVIDAGAITELRTAAASAWATEQLSSPYSSRLAILGNGVQARKHVQMMRFIRPIESITIWGRDSAHTGLFAAWCREKTGLRIEVKQTPEEAVSGTDIICTVTASKSPLLRLKDLKPHCHVNAVGASAPGFQELDADVYAGVELYVDSRDAAWQASSCLQEARKNRLISAQYPISEIGELGDALSSRRTSRSKPTVFKSVGIAAQDLVFARAVVRMCP